MPQLTQSSSTCITNCSGGRAGRLRTRATQLQSAAARMPDLAAGIFSKAWELCAQTHLTGRTPAGQRVALAHSARMQRPQAAMPPPWALSLTPAKRLCSSSGSGSGSRKHLVLFARRQAVCSAAQIRQCCADHANHEQQGRPGSREPRQTGRRQSCCREAGVQLNRQWRDLYSAVSWAAGRL